MRLPIILMLLTLVLLPADLQGLAAQVQYGIDTVRAAAVEKLLDRHDNVLIAEASPEPALGGKATEIR